MFISAITDLLFMPCYFNDLCDSYDVNYTAVSVRCMRRQVRCSTIGNNMIVVDLFIFSYSSDLHCTVLTSFFADCSICCSSLFPGSAATFLYWPCSLDQIHNYSYLLFVIKNISVVFISILTFQIFMFKQTKKDAPIKNPIKSLSNRWHLII